MNADENKEAREAPPVVVNGPHADGTYSVHNLIRPELVELAERSDGDGWFISDRLVTGICTMLEDERKLAEAANWVKGVIAGMPGPIYNALESKVTRATLEVYLAELYCSARS
jgi:hypothetical protein